MSAEKIIESLKHFCVNSSGDPLGQTWQGNKATYQWNLGRTTEDGVVNGVVRKLESIEVSGRQIWVVAGSFKISPNGEILRFTGLPKKFQKIVTDGAVTPITNPSTTTVTV